MKKTASKFQNLDAQMNGLKAKLDEVCNQQTEALYNALPTKGPKRTPILRMIREIHAFQGEVIYLQEDLWKDLEKSYSWLERLDRGAEKIPRMMGAHSDGPGDARGSADQSRDRPARTAWKREVGSPESDAQKRDEK